MRSAISPRLAMRTLRNTLRPPAWRGGRELDEDEVLAVLDRVARLDEAGADHAVGRGDDLLRDAEHVDRAEPVAGPHLGPGTRLGRGWKMPTAGDVATMRPSSRPPRPVRSSRAPAPSRAAPVAAVTTGSDRGQAGRLVRARGPAPDRAARSRSPGRRSRAGDGALPSPGRRRRTRQPPSRTSSSPSPVAPSLAMRAGSSSSLSRPIAAWSAERSASVRSRAAIAGA